MLILEYKILKISHWKFRMLYFKQIKAHFMDIQTLENSYHRTLLAELGDPKTKQPRVSQIIHAVYDSLFGVIVSQELETEVIKQKTKIYAEDKRGIFEGKVFKKDQKVVVCDLIRAGIEPSALFYHKLTEILNPDKVRQDHVMAQRIETKHGVEATDLMGSKIGGSIDNAIVFIPDPMGATGHSLQEVIEFYLARHGQPKKFVAVHLVITPEYLEHMKKIDAPLTIYAARKDKGLTEQDYIYPGLGGVGEMISNTEK